MPPSQLVPTAIQRWRASYELMPDSFGRMESHCFGCEQAFNGARAEDIAERVFRRFLAKTPRKPQVHYLLGYLREEQERYDEALPFFQRAVQLDPDYLNAWKHLQDLGRYMEIGSAQRDEAALNLLRLDPQGRHVGINLTKITSLRVLWNVVETAVQKRAPEAPATLYPLAGSKAQAEKQAAAERAAYAEYGVESDETDDLPSEATMDEWEEYGHSDFMPSTPGEAVATHKAMRAVTSLMNALLQSKQAKPVS